jgi:hypothetical protein
MNECMYVIKYFKKIYKKSGILPPKPFKKPKRSDKRQALNFLVYSRQEILVSKVRAISFFGQ